MQVRLKTIMQVLKVPKTFTRLDIESIYASLGNIYASAIDKILMQCKKTFMQVWLKYEM